jgi:hypothetical protein
MYSLSTPFSSSHTLRAEGPPRPEKCSCGVTDEFRIYFVLAVVFFLYPNGALNIPVGKSLLNRCPDYENELGEVWLDGWRKTRQDERIV